MTIPTQVLLVMALFTGAGIVYILVKARDFISRGFGGFGKGIDNFWGAVRDILSGCVLLILVVGLLILFIASQNRPSGP